MSCITRTRYPNPRGILPRCVAVVRQRHITSAEVIEHAQSGQAAVDTMTSFDANQTSDARVVESTYNSFESRKAQEVQESLERSSGKYCLHLTDSHKHIFTHTQRPHTYTTPHKHKHTHTHYIGLLRAHLKLMRILPWIYILDFSLIPNVK